MQLGTYQLTQCTDAAPVVVPLEIVVYAIEEWFVAHRRYCIGKCFAVLCVVVYLGEELIGPLVDADGYARSLIAVECGFYHSEPLRGGVAVAAKVLGQVKFPQAVDAAGVGSCYSLSNAGLNRCDALCHDVGSSEFL